MVLGQDGRLIEGDNEVVPCGAEKIFGRDPLHEGVPPEVSGDMMPAAGDHVLVVQSKAGQFCPFRGPGYKILKIGHAHVWFEGVDEIHEFVDVLIPVQECRDGSGYSGGDVHFVVFENGAQVRDAVNRELSLQNGRGVIIADKEKLMLPEAAGYGEPAHGVPVPGTVNAVENACHCVNPEKKRGPA